MEELHDLYFFPSVIRMIKLRRMILVGHVARLGEKRKARKKDTTRKMKM
jgi:hypothetical protein